jgi:serine phosphatase RsbU (regulator of sigma subunit)
MLVLYTDGIIEAENAEGELFGEERLCWLLHELRPNSPQKIIDSLLEQVREYTGMQNFTDDVSLVVMKSVSTAPVSPDRKSAETEA